MKSGMLGHEVALTAFQQHSGSLVHFLGFFWSHFTITSTVRIVPVLSEPKCANCNNTYRSDLAISFWAVRPESSYVLLALSVLVHSFFLGLRCPYQSITVHAEDARSVILLMGLPGEMRRSHDCLHFGVSFRNTRLCFTLFRSCFRLERDTRAVFLRLVSYCRSFPVSFPLPPTSA
jgi:hypothetical protein